MAASAFIAGAVALAYPTSIQAAPAPVLLGTAASFGVLAGQGVTNTGPTVVGADLGTCPNPAITGFPPGQVLGTIHANDAVACQAQADLTTAYNDAAGRAPTVTYPGAQDLGGMTLVAGVYNTAVSFAITGPLTLDGQNDPDSVFIFQAGSTLITAPDSSVVFINGAQACNVFWQIGSSATLGVGSTMQGTVMALSAITANTNAAIDGRLLTRNAGLTMDSNQVRPAPCTVVPPATTTSTTAAGATSTTAAGATSTTLGSGEVTTTSTPLASGATTSTSAALGAAGSGNGLPLVATTTTRPEITVTDLAPGRGFTTATVRSNVPSQRSSLPRTGASQSEFRLVLGLVLLSCGVLLTAASRRPLR